MHVSFVSDKFHIYTVFNYIKYFIQNNYKIRYEELKRIQFILESFHVSSCI